MVVNLVYEGKSEVKYEKIKYPDNQVSIDIKEEVDKEGHYEIHSRMNSYDDLFYILAATDVLRHKGVKDIALYVPCFMAQRSDRRFREEHQSFDLGVIANIINQQGYTSVTVMHAHSDVLPAIVERCHVLNNYKLVNLALSYYPNPVLVSPDAGAYKKVGEMGMLMGLDVVAANKFRSRDDIHLEVAGNVVDKVCLIVDDYCDGGRTFIKLGSKLKELGARRVDLAITHGLFSNGFSKTEYGPGLEDILDRIYVTNSIQDITNNKLITQLNIF